MYERKIMLRKQEINIQVSGLEILVEYFNHSVNDSKISEQFLAVFNWQSVLFHEAYHFLKALSENNKDQLCCIFSSIMG